MNTTLPPLHKDFLVTHGINGKLELFIFRNNKTESIYEKYFIIQYREQPIRDKYRRVWRFMGGA